MQGLNLTPLHGHTALFGVYGMLGIGLMLFCLRGLQPNVAWNERLLQDQLLGFNIGLALMALLTLLPIGVHAARRPRSSTATGMRARPSSCSKPIIQLLVWMRVPGDTIFSVGALALAWFVLRLWIAPQHGAVRRVPGATSAGPSAEPRSRRCRTAATARSAVAVRCSPRHRIGCCSSSARATCCWR